MLPSDYNRLPHGVCRVIIVSEGGTFCHSLWSFSRFGPDVAEKMNKKAPWPCDYVCLVVHPQNRCVFESQNPFVASYSIPVAILLCISWRSTTSAMSQLFRSPHHDAVQNFRRVFYAASRQKLCTNCLDIYFIYFLFRQRHHRPSFSGMALFSLRYLLRTLCIGRKLLLL